MFTNKEAKYLLNLNKLLNNPEQIVDLKDKKNRLELFSPEDNDYKFWLEITSNKKIILKTSLHHLESNSFIGLLRIDFKGRHINPPIADKNVPLEIGKYVGKRFEIDEPHMHIYVEGYKPLVWAIPLSKTDFGLKEIKEYGDLSE